MTTTITRTVGIRELSEPEDNDWLFEGIKQPNTSSRVATKFDSEAEHDKSTNRSLDSSDSQDAESKIGIKSATSHRVAATDSQADSLEPTPCNLFHFATTSSGYPLHHLHCWSDAQTVTLSGQVTRYFHLQLALEIAKRLANGRRIENHITVQPGLDRDQYTD